MLQIVPKWQVEVTLSSGVRRSIWIHDNFINNVLRQVAGMSFDANPLVRVDAISVSLVEIEQQVGTALPDKGNVDAVTKRVSG